jgi:opacity protein-like surface antigen
MNRVGHVLLMIFLCTVFASGQDTTSRRKNSLEEGAWAVQFGIGSNFTITTFAGSTIALKHFCSSSQAYRLSATVNGSTDSRDGVTPLVADSMRIITTTDGNSESLSLQFNMLFYPLTSSDVNFYWGIGPSGTYSHSNSTSETRFVTSSQDTVYSRQSDTRNTWGIGASVVVGVEWFATKSISLNAEYTGTLNYTHSSSSSEGEIPSRPASESTSKSFSVNSGGVRFGLAAYF